MLHPSLTIPPAHFACARLAAAPAMWAAPASRKASPACLLLGGAPPSHAPSLETSPGLPPVDVPQPPGSAAPANMALPWHLAAAPIPEPSAVRRSRPATLLKLHGS